MDHLLSSWSDISERFHQAKRILLFSDYDGTLTPIVEQPELAQLSDYTRKVLQALSSERRIMLGIISGRALSDLKEKVNITNLIYAGNHGFEIEGPGLSFVNPLAEEIRPVFRAISRLLVMAFETTKGTFIENKGLTLSVHYRQAENENHVRSVFRKVIRSISDIAKFKVTTGKKVYELRPAINWDKGKAIQLLIERYGHKNGRSHEVLPIYLGDDTTDEDGFDVIREYKNGISVHIGNHLKRTAADYYLRSPEEVSEFLKMLLESSRRGFK